MEMDWEPVQSPEETLSRLDKEKCAQDFTIKSNGR
jgi:hypothetical protein